MIHSPDQHKRGCSITLHAHQAEVAMSNVSELLNVPSKPIRQKIKLKSGAKSTYSEQAVDKFCQGIAAGLSMREVCKQSGTPSVHQAFVWMRKYPSFAERYARACEERGMHFGHKLTELAEGVLKGEIDPQAARVAGDFYKFTAARLASKTWGEKSQVTVEHSVSAQAAQVLQDLAQRRKQQTIIDVTPTRSLSQGDVELAISTGCEDTARIARDEDAGE